MKKVIASFAVTIYFAFACGVMVNYHFCMNRFSSFSFYKASTDWCGLCGMHISKSRGCCHDEVKILKLQDDHQTSSVLFQFKTFQPAITFLPEFSAAEINNDLSVDHLNHSPPLLHGQDTYLLNCVFRI
jgi:hypothetical protein